jgi:hypothetical protein
MPTEPNAYLDCHIHAPILCYNIVLYIARARAPGSAEAALPLELIRPGVAMHVERGVCQGLGD